MFYAAGSRRSQFLRGRASARSSPLSSIANSSGRITTQPASVAVGQRKRPFSSRFAHTHSPLPSHTSPSMLPKTTVEYRKFDEGVWFPVSYGTEFRFHVLFFYSRQIAVSMVNSDFRRADVKSSVEFETTQ